MHYVEDSVLNENYYYAQFLTMGIMQVYCLMHLPNRLMKTT